MPVGITDLKSVITIPGNWDLTYLKRWSLADGTTFDRLVAQLGGAMVLFNRSLTQGYWAQYWYPTTQIESEYFVGGDSNELEKVSEYTRPDPLRGKTTGHMIPMHDYGGALGWTYMALRRGTMPKLSLGMRHLVERAQNTWQKRLLERLFTSASETVGTAGKSVPFADGGTADSAYVPPYYDGRTFLYTHNHFDRQLDTEAGRQASILAGMFHLMEHGIMPPYDLVIPEGDLALWYAMDEFVPPQRSGINTAALEVRGTVDEGTYVGLYECQYGVARVKTEARLPVNYCGLFKPAGHGSPMSPLAVRYEPGYPLGLSLVGTIQSFPLQDAVAYFTFGDGIANRLAGYACYFYSSSTYVDPTIT
jgi:hypothetical protein